MTTIVPPPAGRAVPPLPRCATVRALLGPDLRRGEAPDPDPRPDQAVVAVRATSVNRGEARRVGGDPDGELPGWELAGVVEAAAADGRLVLRIG